MIELALFDFDGTLVRSHEQVHEVLRELAQEFRFELPPIEELRQLSTRETIAKLGIPFWRVPRLAKLARRKLNSRLEQIAFEPGVLDAVRALNSRVALLSSNSPENVHFVLRKNAAEGLFEEIICGSSFLSKHRQLKKALKTLRVKAANAIYVCDETRDLEAARIAGMKTLAVGWGFHSKTNLLNFKPDFFADRPEDLYSILGMPK